MSFLLVETKEYEKFYPIAHSKFLWDISCGIFNPLERYEKLFPGIKLYSLRFEKPPFSFLKEGIREEKLYDKKGNINTVLNSQFIPYEILSFEMNTLGLTTDGNFVYLRSENISQDIIDKILNLEIEKLSLIYKTVIVKNGKYLSSFLDLIKENEEVIERETYLIRNDKNFLSPRPQIYIHKEAKIQEFVSLQEKSGSIIIDQGSTIRSFSIIDGPAYIGKNTLIDSARIRSGSTIKHHCKIGGEIESSIIESYTNKHHEGFLGHSYVGSWVNIGAMSTTSDLKNNYGNVKLEIDGKKIDTGTIKFGSIICDFVKIGIGVMLSTGSVIREGASVVFRGKEIQKYIPPFYWDEGERYDINKFIKDISRMMERRNIKLSHLAENFLRALYNS